MWNWLTSLLNKKSSRVTAASNPGASLPPLPTGSVSAVADALTQAGRIVEQQTAIRNTSDMKEGAIAQQLEQRKEQIEKDVANNDLDAIRRDAAS